MRRLRLPAAQEQLEGGGGRELGSSAEAAVDAVIALAQPDHRVRQGALGHRLVGGPQEGAAAQALGDALAAGADLVRAVGPGFGHGLQHLAPARSAHARLGWEVGAGVEGHLLGGEEHVQRPAARPGHRLAGLHVDGVDVRALLAVELDAHEALVHEVRRPLVLEGLAFHHVAPVAGRVADREQDRALLAARATERLLAPRIPVHGVVLVLEQVGRRLAGQAVGHWSEATRIGSG